MSLIFLDIDGVINPEYYMRYLHERNTRDNRLDFRDAYGHLFDPHCVAELKRLIDTTDADIVISSAWRLAGLGVMQEMWVDRDLPGDVVGITPAPPYVGHEQKPRGHEIQAWLDAIPHQPPYVILDDADDMLDNQLPYLIQTDYKIGLMPWDVDAAIKVLTQFPRKL